MKTRWSIWVEPIQRGKIFIQQYLMKESKLEKVKHFFEFLASEFIDANPQTISKRLIFSTSPIHLTYINFSYFWSKIRKKCMGKVHQEMTLEYFNLSGVLLHQKPWRLICWSPSNSPKEESYGSKQYLKEAIL